MARGKYFRTVRHNSAWVCRECVYISLEDFSCLILSLNSRTSYILNRSAVISKAWSIHIFLQPFPRSHPSKEKLGIWENWFLSSEHLIEVAEFHVWPLDGDFALVRWTKCTLATSKMLRETNKRKD